MWCFRKKLEKFSHAYDVILTSSLSFENYFNTTKSQLKQLSKRPWVGKGCIYYTFVILAILRNVKIRQKSVYHHHHGRSSSLSAGKRDRGKIAAPPPPLRSRGGGGAGAKPPTLPCEAGRGGQEVKSVYPLDVGCRFSLYSRIQQEKLPALLYVIR